MKTNGITMDLQLFSNSIPPVDNSKPQETMQDQSFKDKVMNFLQGNQGGGQQVPPQQVAVEQPAQGQVQQVQQAPQDVTPANADNVAQDGGQATAQSTAPTNQPQEQVQSAPQQTPADNNGLILGKFKSPEEVVNAYSNLEKFNTQTRQELAQDRQTIGQLQAAIEQMQQTQQQPPNDDANEGDQNNVGMSSEDFMNRFYEKPQDVIKQVVEQLVQQAVNQNIAPITQQLQPIIDDRQEQQRQTNWNNNVNQFASAHNDFGNFTSDMQQILDNMPELGNHPKGVEIIYNMAKGNQYKEPNQYLQDENFLNNNVLNNDDIKQKIITEYLQSVKKDGQAPIVIAGQPGGDIQMTPENKPKTMEEAKTAAMKLFGM